MQLWSAEPRYATSRSKMTHSRGSVTQQLMSVLYVLFLMDWMVLLPQARTIRRLCKSQIDIMSSDGVKIEGVDQSHVELALASKRVRKRDYIKFEFRTTGSNGILFYGRHRHDPNILLGMRLIGGDVYYKIHCSTVSADVLIPSRKKLNDGKWHKVELRFRRGGRRKTQIELDGVRDTKTYEVSCGLPSTLVFGGVSRHDTRVVSRILGRVPHYEGCIKRVNVPKALSSPPKYYAVSICET